MPEDGLTTDSLGCRKRPLDKSRDDFLKCKQVKLTPPPSNPGLSPCLRPRSPAPSQAHSQSPYSIGPYLLMDLCERAKTYVAVHTHTQQQYTCKVLPLSGFPERLAPYTHLPHHDNVCRLMDVMVCEDSVYLFLPGHYGDLQTYVREQRRVGEDEARRLFVLMLSAVEHCHQHGVLLRDLKLCKFVFTDKHRTSLALQTLDDSILLHRHHDDALTDRHGCPAYVGPELLTNGRRSYSGRAADIWSLGVSLYTMLIGRYPFQDMQPAALFAKIRQGTYSLPDWLSPHAKCVIGCMLRKSPDERLKAAELLMHPWISSPDTRSPHTLSSNTHTLPSNTHTPLHDTHNPLHDTPTQRTPSSKPSYDDQEVPTFTENPTHTHTHTSLQQCSD